MYDLGSGCLRGGMCALRRGSSGLPCDPRGMYCVLVCGCHVEAHAELKSATGRRSAPVKVKKMDGRVILVVG